MNDSTSGYDKWVVARNTLKVDVLRGRATNNGELLTVTALSMRLLALLMTKGKAHRDDLLRRVWGRDPTDPGRTNVVDVQMSRVRKSLTDAGFPKSVIRCEHGFYILDVYGTGNSL